MICWHVFMTELVFVFNWKTLHISFSFPLCLVLIACSCAYPEEIMTFLIGISTLLLSKAAPQQQNSRRSYFVIIRDWSFFTSPVRVWWTLGWCVCKIFSFSLAFTVPADRAASYGSYVCKADIWEYLKWLQGSSLRYYHPFAATLQEPCMEHNIDRYLLLMYGIL